MRTTFIAGWQEDVQRDGFSVVVQFALHFRRSRKPAPAEEWDSLLLLFRQLRLWVIQLAAAVLDDFVAEGGSIILLAREGISLALVVPAAGIEALGFLEVRDGLSLVAGFVELLREAELGGGHRQVGIAGGELFAQA